jgi:putative transposase
MHRGLERRHIFKDTYDREVFLGMLGEIVERYRFVIHAYCLMDNYYHAIIQTPDANLSRGLQWLGLSYSSYFNARHNRVGPLFQGRFKSVPVEDGVWAYDLSLYVHVNPVRTNARGLGKARTRANRLGLSPAASPEEAVARLRVLRAYRSSSYRAYAGYEKGPDWLTISEVRRRCPGTERDEAKRYRSRMRDLVRSGADKSKMEAFRDVVGIGSAAFIGRLKELAGRGSRETEARARLRNRVGFSSVVQAVEEVRGEPSSEWLHRHGDWGKWLVLKVAREYTGMTLQELGASIGGMDYAAVCMGLRRFDQRLTQKKANKDITKIYEHVRKKLDA